MTKKWLMALSGPLLAAIIVTGCADDQDPAPPEDTNEQLPDENGESPVDENLDENMDPQGTGEDNGNGELMEEEGTEEGNTEEGTTEEGNTEGENAKE
ncbi:hypothetical protein [Metabacillus sp. FJAT-53654]|uniref:Uncharacterized protein n=1 Tax=Metabacillus rhizosphaerae TaxID=3117747 RepID=A0ABZ2MVZ9_9BACI